MEIKRAAVLGFCFGVRRAVELADSALQNYTLQNSNQKKVYSLGPLIHNEAALKNLADKGLQILEEDQISDLPENSVVIIRAHGVAPSVINQLNQKKAVIIDATCPRVKASQKMVERYTSEQDFVILTGDKNHGEVKGIAGYAGKNFLQLQNSEEAEKLDFFDKSNKAAANSADKNFILLSQTTYSETEFSQIEKILKNKIKNITVMNTICPATKERQEALVDLCQEVEGVLVIGGKNSANTIRLYQTAEKNCKYAAHIQQPSDIPPVFYSLKKIGITAGASTPDELIEAVEKSLS